MNTTNNTSYQEEKPFGNINLLITSICGIVTAVFLIIYIIKKMKLNQHLKNTFILMAFHNLIGFFISMIANIIMMVFEYQENWYFCTFFINSWIFLIWSNWTLSTVISVSRYYMAWKASKTQIAKRTILITGIILGTLIVYAASIVVFIRMHCQKGALLNLCLKSSDNDQKSMPIIQILNAFYSIGVICTGLFFDLKMLIFAKKRKKLEQKSTELVPWKSISSNQKETIEVPVRATAFSSISLLLCMILFPLVLSTLQNKESNFWNIIITGSIGAIIYLPLLLLFTIKRKKKQKVAIQPPKALNFHDEIEELDTEKNEDESFSQDEVEYPRDQCSKTQTGSPNLLQNGIPNSQAGSNQSKMTKYNHTLTTIHI